MLTTIQAGWLRPKLRKLRVTISHTAFRTATARVMKRASLPTCLQPFERSSAPAGSLERCEIGGPSCYRDDSRRKRSAKSRFKAQLGQQLATSSRVSSSADLQSRETIGDGSDANFVAQFHPELSPLSPSLFVRVMRCCDRSIDRNPCVSTHATVPYCDLHFNDARRSRAAP